MKNLNMQKLKKISGVFKVVTIVFAAIAIIFVGYGYLVNDELSLETSDLFVNLWESPSISHSLLLLFKLPFFIAFVLGVYWLYKLLSFYQNGEFFSEQTMRCYLWLLWIKVFDFLMEFVETLSVGLYHASIFGNAKVEFAIDFSEITTILLMLVIAYLLKAAKEIEAENKEFI